MGVHSIDKASCTQEDIVDWVVPAILLDRDLVEVSFVGNVLILSVNNWAVS